MKNKDDILKELSEENPFLVGIEKSNPNTVPEGYFAQLPDRIIALIKQPNASYAEIRGELAEIAPLLNAITKSPLQSVPDGYFEQVNFATPVLALPKKSAKIVSMPTVNRWLQLSAAAVIVGIFITGAFMFTNNRENYSKYADYTQIDMPSELHKISEAELEKYLFEPDHNGLTQMLPGPVMEEDMFDVASNIQLISDEALSQYILANTEPGEKRIMLKK